MNLPRLLLLVLVLFALGVGVSGALAPTGVPDREPVIVVPTAPTSPTPPRTSAVVEALSVLHAWDARRADAWATGDVRELGGLYTASSEAGRRDRAMLRSWLHRGLRVRGLRMQVLAARVRVRTDDRIVLTVTDRLAHAEAVGTGVRLVLPRDGASTRTLALRRVAGEWRVASVRDGARLVQSQDRPMESTARTWPSRKS